MPASPSGSTDTTTSAVDAIALGGERERDRRRVLGRAVRRRARPAPATDAAPAAVSSTASPSPFIVTENRSTASPSSAAVRSNSTGTRASLRDLRRVRSSGPVVASRRVGDELDDRGARLAGLVVDDHAALELVTEVQEPRQRLVQLERLGDREPLVARAEPVALVRRDRHHPERGQVVGRLELHRRDAGGVGHRARSPTPRSTRTASASVPAASPPVAGRVEVRSRDVADVLELGRRRHADAPRRVERRHRVGRLVRRSATARPRRRR